MLMCNCERHAHMRNCTRHAHMCTTAKGTRTHVQLQNACTLVRMCASPHAGLLALWLSMQALLAWRVSQYSLISSAASIYCVYGDDR